VPRRRFSFTFLLSSLLWTAGCDRPASTPPTRSTVTIATNGPALAAALRNRNAEVRVAAARLIASSSIAVDSKALVHALDDGDSNVRRNCAVALGRMRAKEAIKPLFLLLQDSDWFVRAEAATALGRIGDPRSAGWLLQMLNDGDAYVRFCAGAALRDVTVESHRDMLLQAYTHATAATQPNIAMALARLREPSVLDRLISVTQTNDVVSRRRVVEALGDYPARAVSNTLALLLSDADDAVRQEAARALQRSGSSR
jgi:HEAT repeat protein